MTDSPPPLERQIVDVPLPSRKRKRELDSDDEMDLENQRISIAKSTKDIDRIDTRERHNTQELLRLVQLGNARIAKLEARLNAQSTFFLARLAELQATATKPRKPRVVKVKQES